MTLIEKLTQIRAIGDAYVMLTAEEVDEIIARLAAVPTKAECPTEICHVLGETRKEIARMLDVVYDLERQVSRIKGERDRLWDALNDPMT